MQGLLSAKEREGASECRFSSLRQGERGASKCRVFSQSRREGANKCMVSSQPKEREEASECRVSVQPRKDREPVNAGFSFGQGEIGSQ